MPDTTTTTPSLATADTQPVDIPTAPTLAVAGKPPNVTALLATALEQLTGDSRVTISFLEIIHGAIRSLRVYGYLAIGAFFLLILFDAVLIGLLCFLLGRVTR